MPAAGRWVHAFRVDVWETEPENPGEGRRRRRNVWGLVLERHLVRVAMGLSGTAVGEACCCCGWESHARLRTTRERASSGDGMSLMPLFRKFKTEVAKIPMYTKPSTRIPVIFCEGGRRN